GNVRYVIGDMRVLETVSVANGNEFTVITTDQQLEWSDYYPYGSYLPGRHVENGEGYRFGFQGQERDNELKGNGNSLNYKYRMHDARTGRFFALDPLAPKYPYYSPYQFSGN
ncbi:hypothetical protein G5B10_16135, partial [Fluviicola sp. SGL-29]|nr:hypothetical protein [Fluviicola sp. SGL-29]